MQVNVRLFTPAASVKPAMDSRYLDNPSWVSFPGASERLSRFWRNATEVRVEKNQVTTVSLHDVAHYR